MDQNKLPLYEALLEYRNKNTHSFHVPGHKNGSVLPIQAQHIYESVLSIDVTELTGLDDLHHASGVIKEAEDLAANLYGSKSCFFLVGGSTVGNLAMIMATCKEGDTVLVQRNSHKSIINGLKLAKVNPIFIEPNYDDHAQLATCLDESLVIDTLKKYKNVKALIMTRPNYYGYTNSIKRIVEVAHKLNIVVLVDEAHGAHFGHHSSMLPNSAIDYHADIVVQSAHKTLPAMTMSSYLHYNSKLVDINKLKYYLQLFQSSSPSYPLMASLDLARFYLAKLPEVDLAMTLKLIGDFKKVLNEIPQLKVVESAEYKIDPLKVTIQSRCHLTGFELQKLLETEGIYTELADQCNVLFVLPLTINTDLISVAKNIKDKLKGKKVTVNPMKVINKFESKVSSLDLTYAEMEQLDIEVVPLEKTLGKVTSEEIIPYPPGIPLLIRGEKIKKAHLERLIALKKSGAYFQGTDVFTYGLKVFKTDETRNSYE
jgi:arginine/lysine/ornithine decarboxylase